MLETESPNCLVNLLQKFSSKDAFTVAVVFVPHLIMGFYYYVSQAGTKVADPALGVFNGQEVEVWPCIIWKPKWALTFVDVKSKVNGNCFISQRSTMSIKGRRVFVEDLSLDGAVLIDSTDDAEVCT